MAWHACEAAGFVTGPQARSDRKRIVALLAFAVVFVSGLDGRALRCLMAEEPPAAVVRPVAQDLDEAEDLAIAPNGQRLFALTGTGEQLCVIDVGRSASGTVRPLFHGKSPDGPAIGIGCIDGSVVVLLHRGSPGGVLTTHRLPGTDETTDLAESLQRVEVTATLANEARPGLAVSPSRDWLAVTGVDAGGEATVLRSAIARVRLGPVSPRHSPVLPVGSSLLTATIGASDDLVLTYRPAFKASEPHAAATPSSDRLSMHAMLGGRTLLDLDTGLENILDACVSLGRGTLWILTGEAGDASSGQPAGLWRLDLVISNRRQAAQPRLITSLDDPRAVVAVGDELLYVADQGGRRLLEVRPAAQAAAAATP